MSDKSGFKCGNKGVYLHFFFLNQRRESKETSASCYISEERKEERRGEGE